MLRGSITVAAITLLVIAGALNGLWTGQWGNGEAVEAARARLDLVPMTVGDWDGADIRLEPRMLPQEASGPYLMRRYVNRETGNVVSIFLTCGRPGPTLIHHSPLVCYPSFGFKTSAGPAKHEIPCGDGSATFNAAGFSKPDGPTPTYVKVYWSWSGDGSWRVPDHPRLAFATFPTLVKFYAIRQMSAEDDSPATDPCEEFLREFVPELRKTLFAKS